MLHIGQINPYTVVQILEKLRISMMIICMLASRVWAKTNIIADQYPRLRSCHVVQVQYLHEHEQV